MMDLAEVDVTISTSGKRLYSSMTTMRYFPGGRGPRKSIASSFHWTFASGVFLSGSSCSALFVVAA